MSLLIPLLLKYKLRKRKKKKIMSEEILNLEHNQKIMTIKALKKTKKIKEAAIELGINERTLYMWMKKFNLNKKNYIYGI